MLSGSQEPVGVPWRDLCDHPVSRAVPLRSADVHFQHFPQNKDSTRAWSLTPFQINARAHTRDMGNLSKSFTALQQLSSLVSRVFTPPTTKDAQVVVLKKKGKGCQISSISTTQDFVSRANS